MRYSTLLAVTAVGLSVAARAQSPAPDAAASQMVGAWEISNAARDKVCPLVFTVEPASGRYKLNVDAVCGTVFPSLKGLALWAMGPNDSVQLFDGKGAALLEFAEVESQMYEGERKGEGLYFMHTQAAIKAETVTPDQLFGDWALLQEFEKPLCKVTLSDNSSGGEGFRLAIKPGCQAAIAGLGLSTWRLENNELLLSGSGGTWRFSESDAVTWERIPPSTDPMLLMRQ
jgi:hypothetical protein